MIVFMFMLYSPPYNREQSASNKTVCCDNIYTCTVLVATIVVMLCVMYIPPVIS